MEEMGAPVQVDENLEADDGVVLVVGPKEVQHERHERVGVRLEGLVMREALDDLQEGVTKFLEMTSDRERQIQVSLGEGESGGVGGVGERGRRSEARRNGPAPAGPS